MNVQQALWHIIEKTHFCDFDFTDEFIEMCKTKPEYDGLYDVLILRICKRFGIKKNIEKEIKTTNPYPLVQQLIDFYNSDEQSVIFQFEEYNNYVKKTLDTVYEEIDKIFKEDKDNLDPHTNSLIIFSYILELSLLQPHKYPELPIIQKCMAFSNMNKVISTCNIVLIKKQTDIFKEKYNDVSTRWIKYNTTLTQLIDSKQDIKHTAECVRILFPNKNMQMYADIICCMNLCGELQRMRLEKKYEYADYIIDVPPYDNYTGVLNHYIQTARLTFEIEIKKDNTSYISYLKNLFENESKFVSQSMLSDYVSLLFNNKNYTEVYNIYKKYKKYIIHKLQSPFNILVRLNLILVIISSGYVTNKNVSKKEINEIMANIKPEDHVDNGTIKNIYKRINSIISAVDMRDNLITRSGFSIVDRSKLDETCLNCLEDIDDTNTETVLCVCCKKELGHINCIAKWIENKQTCPNCRSSVEQRLSIKE